MMIPKLLVQDGKWRFRAALCIPVSLLFFASGCATDPEDREFFNAGWVRPEKGAEARMGESGRATKTRGAALTPHAPPEHREAVF